MKLQLEVCDLLEEASRSNARIFQASNIRWKIRMKSFVETEGVDEFSAI